jgi:hypothetical protein
VSTSIISKPSYRLRNRLIAGCAILTVLTACCVAVPLCAKWKHISTIQAAGGTLEYDYTSLAKRVGCAVEKLEAIDTIAGWAMLASVERVQLGHVNNDVLDSIAKLGSVRVVSSYQDCSVPSRSFLRLSGLTDLHQLTVCVRGGPEDDEFLKYADCWPKLAWVSLMGSNVTDVGLARSARLPSVVRLQICGEEITDSGIASLEVMPGLKVLELDAKNVTAAAIHRLELAKPGLMVFYQSEDAKGK